jgi:hypothetical protein
VDTLEMLRHAHNAVGGNLFHESSLACALRSYDTVATILSHLQYGVLNSTFGPHT